MGGLINVTLRDEDGSVYKMARWTNGTPWMIDNVSLYEKDRDHIDKIIYDYKKMADDFEKNRESGDYEFPMSPVYGSNTGLCPDGYGLIVIDLLKDEILHSQGYTSYGHMYFIAIEMDMRRKVINGSAVDRLREFYESSRIRGFSTSEQRYNDEDFIEFDDDEFQTFHELLDFIKTDERVRYERFKDQIKLKQTETVTSSWAVRDEQEHDDGFDKFIHTPDYVELDTDPFTITQFEENKAGRRKFKSHLEDLGFEFTDEENKVWP